MGKSFRRSESLRHITAWHKFPCKKVMPSAKTVLPVLSCPRAGCMPAVCLAGNCCAKLILKSPVVPVPLVQHRCIHRAWIYQEHRSYWCLEWSEHVYKLQGIVKAKRAASLQTPWALLSPAPAWAPLARGPGQLAAHDGYRPGQGSAGSVLEPGGHLGEPPREFLLCLKICTDFMLNSEQHLLSLFTTRFPWLYYH